MITFVKKRTFNLLCNLSLHIISKVKQKQSSIQLYTYSHGWENLEIDVVITWSHTATNGLLMLEPGSYFPEHVTLLHI